MTIPVHIWQGCYDESWRGLITDEAFAHPAKFAPGLIKRIFSHGIERGWWKRGDLIGDCFGGIAGGGIMAGYAGLNWIGCELESRFVALGLANIALHAPTWAACGDASFVQLVQGDSRDFARIVRDAAGVVTSPPYEGCKTHPSLGHPEQVNGGKGDYLKLATTGAGVGSERYGEADGQIGNDAGETYWQAMALVYSQCFAAIKPGGYACIVVKDYVKARQRVPLCDQTLQLLAHLGFEPVERIRAMLVKETVREGLFGSEKKTTERKSFFRRLAEKKGSPRIDWEEVLVVRKPSNPSTAF